MDPRKQDCFGHYLYGAGYFARDQNTLGLVTGGATPPHFCLSCPKRAQCEDEHETQVRNHYPEMAEAFDRHMRDGIGRGIPATVIALKLSTLGEDPFAAIAIENFKRGHADRGGKSGPLVASGGGA